MDRLTASLLAGAAAVIGAGPALATPAEASPVPLAASYADLLTPIPDAVARLQLADARADAQQPRLIEAQFRHHHHHHHHHNRRWYMNNGYAWLNGAWVLHPRRHHHHHHHN
ncbi:MAG TPA: hypothetical protein VGI95_10325 [Caulobacteraceae bacterium]|jgi:hypothetical protein